MLQRISTSLLIVLLALAAIPTQLFCAEHNTRFSAPDAALLAAPFPGDDAGTVFVSATADAVYIASTVGSVFVDPPTPSAPSYTTQRFGPGGRRDLLVVKLDSSLTNLLYAVVIGGQLNEHIGAMTVDASGSIFLTGGTGSTDFPVTPGSYRTSKTDSVWSFVLKLTADGQRLEYATYFPMIHTADIAVDASGRAWVVGAEQLSSASYITPGAYQRQLKVGSCITGRNPLLPCVDASLARLNPQGSQVEYGTYLGGSHQDRANSILLSTQGDVFIGGITESSDFPISQNRLQPSRIPAVSSQRPEGFLAQFDASGRALKFSSFLGNGDSGSEVLRVATSGGSLYLLGKSGRVGGAGSTSGPTLQPLSSWVVRLSSTATSIGSWTDTEPANSFVVNADGAAMLTTRVMADRSLPGVSERTDPWTLLRLLPDGTPSEAVTLNGPEIAIDPIGRVFVAGNLPFRQEGIFRETRLHTIGIGSPSVNVVRVATEVSTAEDPIFRATSGASFVGPLTAPGAVVSGFGSELARSVENAQELPLPEGLAEAAVILTDSAGVERPASLFYASPSQINFLVPPEAAIGPATARVVSDGVVVGSGQLEVHAVAPTLFGANQNGIGPAAAIAVLERSDGTRSTQLLFNPAALVGTRTALPIDFGAPGDEVVITLFGTGFANAQVSAAFLNAQSSTLNAPVLYAGPQGEFAGLDQINLRLDPIAKGGGETGVVVIIDGKVSNQVTINTGPAH